MLVLLFVRGSESKALTALIEGMEEGLETSLTGGTKKPVQIPQRIRVSIGTYDL